MHVLVSKDLTVKLMEADDFKSFDVRIELARNSVDDLRRSLQGVAELDGDNAAWVLGEWIVREAGASNEAWVAAFSKMVAHARNHGWVRDTPLRIRGHLIWPST